MAETYRSVDRTEAALGKPVRTHARLPRVGPVPMVLTGAFAAFLWWKALEKERIAGAAWVMTALAAVFAVGFLFDLARRKLSVAVTVHERGMVLESATGSRLLMWDELGALEMVRERRLRQAQTVFVPIPGLIVYSDPTEWQWVCRLRVDGRVALELSDRYADSTALIDTIRRETVERRVPNILEELRGGGRVGFGLVAVTEKHLDVRGTIIPWTELGNLTFRGPLLCAFDHNGDELAKATVEKIPDVHIVLALADRLRGRAC